MSKWADENNGEFFGNRWYLYYDPLDGINRVKVVRRGGIEYVGLMQTPFSSKEIAEKAREKFGDEILKVWGDK
jgi:hypothetical protein